MNHDLLVIGGGWAGITAAIEATLRGRRVTLVEANGYLGGRARSFVDKTTGEEIDNGQHVAMGCYHSFLEVLSVLNVNNLFHTQQATRVVFIDQAAKRSTLDASGLPGRLGIAWGILRLSHLGLSERMGILRFASRINKLIVESEGLTCLDLLQQHGQSTAAIRGFWEPIILATLNARIEEAAASLLLIVLQRAFFGTKKDGRILVPTRGLSSLAEPLTQWLESRNGAVMLSTAVDRFVIADSRVSSVVLSNGAVLDVRDIVCAIPQRSLLRLMEASLTGDPEPDDVYAEVEFSPIVSVFLWYDKAWMTDDFVAALGVTVQWVFNRRQLVKTSEDVEHRYPGHVSLTISAASTLASKPIDAILAECDRELRMLFPEMDSAQLLHGIVIKEKQATPLITPRNESMRPPATTAWSNVALAGDWTATGLPATLEGAALSGFRAVDVLMPNVGPSKQ